MSDRCEWCESQNISKVTYNVYWELPDGTRAIKISDVPSIVCNDCQMIYQSEVLVKEIEDQLYLINTNDIGAETSFTNLMTQPRLLKRNYFDFTT